MQVCLPASASIRRNFIFEVILVSEMFTKYLKGMRKQKRDDLRNDAHFALLCDPIEAVSLVAFCKAYMLPDGF